MGNRERRMRIMAKGATSITNWIGSVTSVALHTVLFVISFVVPYLGVVSFEHMLLFLTTIVSLEAIYLSIFIQMSINMNNENIGILQEDIEEISEDIEDLGEDIEELGEDLEELGEDIEEISEDIEEIQKDVDEIQEDVDEIQEDASEEQNADRKETEVLLSIQATLLHLQREIEMLKSASSHK
jgi:septal ring factor EnvC (AmiA/AmiB activator)